MVLADWRVLRCRRQTLASNDHSKFSSISWWLWWSSSSTSLENNYVVSSTTMNINMTNMVFSINYEVRKKPLLYYLKHFVFSVCCLFEFSYNNNGWKHSSSRRRGRRSRKKFISKMHKYMFIHILWHLSRDFVLKLTTYDVFDLIVRLQYTHLNWRINHFCQFEFYYFFHFIFGLLKENLTWS